MIAKYVSIDTTNDLRKIEFIKHLKKYCFLFTLLNYFNIVTESNSDNVL